MKEFGYARVDVHDASRLLRDIEDHVDAEGRAQLDVWMSHGDLVTVRPPGFTLAASTAPAPVAALLHRAIGKRLTCIFVDTGMLCYREAEQVMAAFDRHMGVHVFKVDARERFPGRLAGVADTEGKRKVIGRTFIEELQQAGLYDEVSQAFAVFLPVKSVGVTGDQRCVARRLRHLRQAAGDHRVGMRSRLPPGSCNDSHRGRGGHGAGAVVGDLHDVDLPAGDLAALAPGRGHHPALPAGVRPQRTGPVPDGRGPWLRHRFGHHRHRMQ